MADATRAGTGSYDPVMADAEMIDYDEFALFGENIAEYDLDVGEIPAVRRVDVSMPHDPGRHVSALRWGDHDVEVVFLHGGAQNAHTWDTVVLALGRPALAIDLPGHGHSHWRDDGAYTPMNLADDVAVVVADLAPEARLVVGMSLGGLTAMELAVRHPAAVRSLVMVDITPGVNAEKAKAVIDFVDGPQEFASFDELLARTKEFNPTRSDSSLRRGILHNAAQRPDGSWQWRYDRSSHARSRDDEQLSGGSSSSDAPRGVHEVLDGSNGDPGDSGSSGADGTPESGVHEGADESNHDSGRAPASGQDGDAVSPELHGVGDAASQLAGDVMSPLWDDFAGVAAPLTLVRGSVSPVVDDDDVAEAERRQPDIDVRIVDGAGHSVQGDRPVELAAILADLLA